MYAITRILPAVNNKKCINDVATDNVKLMSTYYNAVRKCCCEQNYSSDDLLHEMAKMIDERIAFLSDFCWVASVNVVIILMEKETEFFAGVRAGQLDMPFSE
jgi:hypothetical protein